MPVASSTTRTGRSLRHNAFTNRLRPARVFSYAAASATPLTDHHNAAGRNIDTDDLVTRHRGLVCFTIPSGPPTLHHRRPALYTGSWWALGYSSASTFRAGGRSSNRITVTDVLGTQRPPGRPQ